MAETSNSNVRTTTPANFSPSLIQEFQNLTEKLDFLYQTCCPAHEKKRCPSNARLADKFNIIDNALKPLYLKDADPPAATRPKRKRKRKRKRRRGEIRSSMNDDETKEPRYILLSNGCAVWLLDLKLSTDQPLTKQADVRPLPKTAMLNLIEEHLPVSVGLFKLGSEAYMIGGQRVSAEALDFCYTSYMSNSVKGTSRATYRFSRTDNSTTLSHSKCKKLKLNSPKFWPIVEEIDGKIHVFDSCPPPFCRPDRGWVFSHEVLNEDGSWRKIPKTGVMALDGFITSHTMVGNCIYAVAWGRFVVFNSETEKWEEKEQGRVKVYWNGKDAFNPEHVWDILKSGTVRCVGEFILEEPAISERIYMLIGIVRSHRRSYGHFKDGTHAVAYLVTSTGKVVCKQSLTRFFKGPMKPVVMFAGTLFKVGESRMCAIVYANAEFKRKEADNNGRDYVFITTFSVEQLAGAAKEVQKLIASNMCGALYEQKFVKVDVRGRYVHGPDADADAAAAAAEAEDEYAPLGKEGDLISFVGMQACCL